MPLLASYSLVSVFIHAMPPPPTPHIHTHLFLLLILLHLTHLYVLSNCSTQESDVLKRNVDQPTLEDHFNKAALPKVMQVKNFGKKGRTKYTHLTDQDTTKVSMRRGVLCWCFQSCARFFFSRLSLLLFPSFSILSIACDW